MAGYATLHIPPSSRTSWQIIRSKKLKQLTISGTQASPKFWVTCDSIVCDSSHPVYNTSLVDRSATWVSILGQEASVIWFEAQRVDTIRLSSVRWWGLDGLIIYAIWEVTPSSCLPVPGWNLGWEVHHPTTQLAVTRYGNFLELLVGLKIYSRDLVISKAKESFTLLSI